MKVIVCGGRDYNDADRLVAELDRIHSEHPITALLYGMARGADDLAKMWATMRGVKRYGFPARWEHHGRSAGPLRNQEMLDTGPDLVVAFPGGAGTRDMVRRAKSVNVKVIEVTPMQD